MQKVKSLNSNFFACAGNLTIEVIWSYLKVGDLTSYQIVKALSLLPVSKVCGEYILTDNICAERDAVFKCLSNDMKHLLCSSLSKKGEAQVC